MPQSAGLITIALVEKMTPNWEPLQFSTIEMSLLLWGEYLALRTQYKSFRPSVSSG